MTEGLNLIYLIAGNGPAGTHAIEQIRSLDPQGKIICVSAEKNLPYSRIMTPEYMVGESEEEELFIRGTQFYEDYRVETRLGVKIAQVLPESNHMLLDNGEQLYYDRLLIATGSSPIIPRWIELATEGVFSLWNKRDSEKIKEYLPQVNQAVIIGAGLVGLQAARALHSYGIQVVIVEMADRLMPTQLDLTASEILAETMSSEGVKILLSTKVDSLVIQNQKVQGVALGNEVIPAEMVLVAIGVQPNLSMFDGIQIHRDKGLVTDSTMQTSIRHIYAAGDVAQTLDGITGESVLRVLWLTAVQQGKIAGVNMAGGNETYLGSHGMNSIQLFGLSMVSLGELKSGPGIEEILLPPAGKGIYRKVLIKEGKLIGLLFVGDIQEAGVLYHKLGQPLHQGYWGSIQVLDIEETA